MIETRRFRSEEHTSELQSRSDLVCRLLLEKKKKKNKTLLHRPYYNILHFIFCDQSTFHRIINHYVNEVKRLSTSHSSIDTFQSISHTTPLSYMFIRSL